MRHIPIGAVTLLICVTGVSAAQQSRIVPVAAPGKIAIPQSALLAADDGLSVIAAALDARNYVSNKADCSHLVHDIYERAGFSYTYVPSTDLYSGIAEFRRVMHPQPGDLIAWPGHVGIIVSPAKHTFYSSLNSGLGVESYDSDYWKQRGRPHFLRFVKPSAAQASGIKTAALKPTSLEAKMPSDPLPANDADAAQPSPTPQILEPVSFPRLLVIDSARPTAEDVSETLLNAMTRNADSLRGRNILGQSQVLVILRQIQVGRVKIKDSAGWADIRTTESAALSEGHSTLKKHDQKQRWILHRRDEKTWNLVPPQGMSFLNEDDAARLISQQLATLTAEESAVDAAQKAQLAALLGSLLQVKRKP